MPHTGNYASAEKMIDMGKKQRGMSPNTEMRKMMERGMAMNRSAARKGLQKPRLLK